MNAITKTEEQPRSVLIDMSKRFGMEPAAFEATVRSTCMKPDKNGKVPTREEFAAFLLVAKEYNLNPLTKEIYAFPAKGGGIVPIVSIDGWVNLINSNKVLDGIQFVMEHDEKNVLISCTCKIYRKDRTHPIEVTEYLSECIRNTEPWAMKHRMLRHKALIQCARYAFGFSGIYDEDEGAKIAEMKDVTPVSLRTPPKPPVPPLDQIEHETNIVDAEIEEQDFNGDITEDGEIIDDTKFFENLEADLSIAGDEATIEEIWTDADPMARFQNDETSQSISLAIKKRALKRVGG